MPINNDQKQYLNDVADVIKTTELYSLYGFKGKGNPTNGYNNDSLYRGDGLELLYKTGEVSLLLDESKNIYTTRRTYRKEVERVAKLAANQLAEDGLDFDWELTDPTTSTPEFVVSLNDYLQSETKVFDHHGSARTPIEHINAIYEACIEAKRDGGDWVTIKPTFSDGYKSEEANKTIKLLDKNDYGIIADIAKSISVISAVYARTIDSVDVVETATRDTYKVIF